MNKMKIAIDVSRLIDSSRKNWQYKGITRYTEQLYKLLCSSDAVQEVTPVVCEEWGGLPLTQQELDDLEMRLQKTPLILTANTLPLDTTFDIYHSTVNPLPSRAKTGRVQRVITIFDCIHLKFPEFYPKGSPPILRTINSIDPENDYVICISECTYKDFTSFVSMDASHIRIIPRATDEVYSYGNSNINNGVEFLQSMGVHRGKYILTLGQMESRKNIHRLIEAFSAFSLDTQYNDFVLVAVCDPKYLSSIADLFNKEGIIPNRYRLIPNVDTRMLAFLYTNAIAFLYVSLYEGFGIPLLEAMGCGCPMIISNASSLPEVAGDAAYYVDPYNSESIMKGIKTILTDCELRSRLVRSGFKRAKLFSWDISIKRTLDFYDWIINTN